MIRLKINKKNNSKNDQTVKLTINNKISGIRK